MPIQNQVRLVLPLTALSANATGVATWSQAEGRGTGSEAVAQAAFLYAAASGSHDREWLAAAVALLALIQFVVRNVLSVRR